MVAIDAHRRRLSLCASGGRAQAESGQLLDAAVVLDQSWVVQRQAAAGFRLDDGFQAGLVDLPIGADRFLQFLRRNGVLVVGQVDRASGEVDTESN